MHRLNLQRPSTLRLIFPFGKTVALAGLVFLMIVVIGEAICRTSWASDRLLAPSLDSDFDTLDVKIDLLNRLADREPIDCVFVGSSMVNRGINLDIFEEAYRQQTGQSVTCFNLGLGSVTGSEAAVMAEYVINTYHPALLVFGLSPRDFSREAVDSGKEIIEVTWMQYARGSFSLKGWLLHHSRLYSYALLYNTWMLPNFESQLKARRLQEDMLAATRGQTTKVPKADPPPGQGPQISPFVASFFRKYVPVPSEMDGLQRILNLHHPPDQQILAVEMPMYQALVTDHLGVEAYQSLMDEIGQRARLQGVLAWPTSMLPLIPANGWQDSLHLSVVGAEIFSAWLGDQIGLAVNQGRLAPFSR